MARTNKSKLGPKAQREVDIDKLAESFEQQSSKPSQPIDKVSSASSSKKVERDRMTLRLPSTLADRLREESVRTGRSVNDIIIERLWRHYND